MAEIQEQMIIAAFVGRRIRPEELEKYTHMAKNGRGAYSDCTEFTVSLPALAEEPETAQAFGISEKQKAQWNGECARFCFMVYVKNGIMVGGHIGKRLRTPLLTEGYETEPSQGDLRVIRCLLQEITEPIAESAAC